MEIVSVLGKKWGAEFFQELADEILIFAVKRVRIYDKRMPGYVELCLDIQVLADESAEVPYIHIRRAIVDGDLDLMAMKRYVKAEVLKEVEAQLRGVMKASFSSGDWYMRDEPTNFSYG